MLNSTTPQSSCDSILQLVRCSYLNFEIKETPFSLFLTIRKSFNKSFRVHQSQSSSFQEDNSVDLLELAAELDMLKSENQCLKVKNRTLEEANDSLTRNFEQEITEAENIKSELKDTVTRLDNLQTNFGNVECKLTNLRNEKKHLESKHLETLDKMKLLKSECAQLQKDNNAASIALRTTKKETKENNQRHQNAIKTYEEKMEELLAFKAADKSEIKKLKNEKKKLTKKLNYIPKSETKSEPIEANVDLNDNNVSAETETSMKDFNFTVPILNPFQVLENLEDVPYSEVIKDDSFKDLLKKEEKPFAKKLGYQ